MTQKARVETEKLEILLRERQIEVEACKKEIEMQKVEKDHLEKRVCEVLHVGTAYLGHYTHYINILTFIFFFKLLERCKNIDVEDYNRMKDDVQQMQVG